VEQRDHIIAVTANHFGNVSAESEIGATEPARVESGTNLGAVEQDGRIYESGHLAENDFTLQIGR
jgi:hypothetical protein